MQRHRRILIALTALVPLLAGGFLVQAEDERDAARMFDQVLRLVSERYVDTVGQAKLYEQAARGLLVQLKDPYSSLLTPKELKRFTTNTGGRYGGIGMQIEDQNGAITVSRVFPHTPAEEAGVVEGDRIIGVGPHTVEGWTLSQVSDSLTGVPGTKVNVRFHRAGVAEPIRVRFTRAVIHIPAVPYAMMLDGNLGYVPLQQFNETASDELSTALRDLRKRGARGIILDLRGNPGGILEQALQVSNLFLPRGKEIASVRGRGTAQHYVTESGPVIPDLPLIVLMDEGSASASEIVAGALQDHDRALIIGQTSFGKGLVQTLFPLDGGYALKMTTAKWFTPSGRSIQKDREVGPDGEFLAATDSGKAELPLSERPAYRSAAGRVVYGGGGITPDVLIADDTLTTVEQELAKALAPKAQAVYVAIQEMAMELKPKVRSDFRPDPAWRAELYRRITKAQVEVDRETWDAGGTWVDRQLSHWIARRAFGDSTAKRRAIAQDAPLRSAVEALSQVRRQEELFALAKERSVAAQGIREQR